MHRRLSCRLTGIIITPDAGGMNQMLRTGVDSPRVNNRRNSWLKSLKLPGGTAFRWGSGFNAISLIIFGLIICCLPFIHTFEDDKNCWGAWSVHILKHGLPEAYGSGTNYLPLYQYILWAYGRVVGSEQAIWDVLPYIRGITLVFDFLGIWILWTWMDGRMAFNTVLFCCMINVAFWYNTVIWGQVDGIEAALVIAALYAAFRRRAVVSGLLCVLALNMKLQAIIFLPVWALLIVPVGITARGRWQLLITGGAMGVLQWLILWPFSYGTGGVGAVWNVVSGAVSYVPRLSVNAFNWWYWATSRYPGEVPDNVIAAMGLTHNQWGFLAFFALSAVALWPLAKRTYGGLRDKTISFSEDDKKCIWLTSALICLLFFFCNTEMHERYAHPAFLFLTAYAFRYRAFGIYILFSIAYLLNLEGIMRWLALPNYGTLIFDGRFVAGIYAVVIVGLFVALYKKNPVVFLHRTRNASKDIAAS